MKQMTLATTGFEKHSWSTWKAEFLAEMERLMPWAELCALIEPHYPKAGNGWPPIGLERMLRMYCLANWFNLADVACEQALYDIPAFRDFCGSDLRAHHMIALSRLPEPVGSAFGAMTQQTFLAA